VSSGILPRESIPLVNTSQMNPQLTPHQNLSSFITELFGILPVSRYIDFALTTHRKLGSVVAPGISVRGQVTWFPASTAGVWRHAPAWKCVYQPEPRNGSRNPAVPLLVCVLLRNCWFCGSNFLAWGKYATILKMWRYMFRRHWVIFRQHTC
jgi:hypothetical protein